jgi:hypothetical protein
VRFLNIHRAALILTALILTGSGCSSRKSSTIDPFQMLRDEIDVQVVESSRAEAMQTALDRIEQAMNELLELTFEHQELLMDLEENYESSREEFDRVFHDYLVKRQPLVGRMLEAHLELKTRATAEEWKPLAKKVNEIVSHVSTHNLAATRSE